MLASKLEEHGAQFLYEKLRAHSITLDLLSTLNVNELITDLAELWRKQEVKKSYRCAFIRSIKCSEEETQVERRLNHLKILLQRH